jgi:beta-galactosidase
MCSQYVWTIPPSLIAGGRWYSGSGIYRHVRVFVTEPTHFAHWGTFVSTPAVSNSTANVRVRTRVANQSGADAGLTLQTTLLDRTGNTVGATKSPFR